jgi:hypothetical protein
MGEGEHRNVWRRSFARVHLRTVGRRGENIVGLFDGVGEGPVLAGGDEAVQLASNPHAGERDVDHDRQRLAREVVNDAERGELSMAFHVAALADHRPSGTKRISFASLCTLRNSASR